MPLAPGKRGAVSWPIRRQAAGVAVTAGEALGRSPAACPPRSTLLSVSKSSGAPLVHWRRGHV